MYIKVKISKVDDYKLWCERHNCEVDTFNDPKTDEEDQEIYGSLDLSAGECRSGGMMCFSDWYIVFLYGHKPEAECPWTSGAGYHTAAQKVGNE
jgi:hypothetical protein